MEKVKTIDIRINMILIIISTLYVIFGRLEFTFVLGLLVALVWLGLNREYKAILTISISYLVALFLSKLFLGIEKLSTIWIFLNIFRKLLLPMAFLKGINRASAGTILEVFQSLRLPKSFGISTIVLLRYVPTVSYELKSIRSSLKYRGIGVGFMDTILHLPSNIKYTMIPLLMRTLKITDELTAAAVVRGVRLDGKVISFEEVNFNKRDMVYCLVFTVGLLTILLLEKLYIRGGI